MSNQRVVERLACPSAAVGRRVLGKLLAQLLAQTVQRVTRRSAVPSRYEIFRPTLLAHSTKVLSGRIGAVVCNGRVRFEHQL